MKEVLEDQPLLDVKQAAVDDLLLDYQEGAPVVAGIRTSTGAE